ncbi:MAG: 4Fe-4S binding protein [Candidatus Omnitrophica bacterium]|nr:4Fe-4S binding protein [Candidatus Omnitrophota bacterium]
MEWGKINKILIQKIMVWFLPLILIGGIFIPVLGYLVFFMMVFFLTLAYFKGRFWCSFLCPRGAFLDLVLSKFSLRRRPPRFFYSAKIRFVIFIVFMIFFVWQLIVAPKSLYHIGFVFVRMCLLTTLISILLGIPFLVRTWCIICPMGNLQGAIAKLRKRTSRFKN